MAAGVKRVRSDWQGAVLVCGKCSRKIGGGFGRKGKTSLAKALRRLLGLKKGRRAKLGIVETRCLGVCPKQAVVVVDARQPGEWLVVPGGVDVDAGSGSIEAAHGWLGPSGTALAVRQRIARAQPDCAPAKAGAQYWAPAFAGTQGG